MPTAERSREDRIADAAYFIGLKRDFVPGFEVEDWKAAEMEVDEAMLSSNNAPVSPSR